VDDTDGVNGRTSTGGLWRSGLDLLTVREQATVMAEDDLVMKVAPETWKNFGMTVQRSPISDLWSIRTSDIVGVAQLHVGESRHHLRITPKIDGLDLIFLADWAYGSSRSALLLPGNRAFLAAIRDEPAACLLGWYIDEMLAFGKRWLRRGYELKREDLSSRIRGRVLVPQYMQRSLARGRTHVLPCEFTEPSQDTPVNRYLKTGLRHVAVLANSVPVLAARTALSERARQALALFANVTDVPAVRQSRKRLNLNGPLRRYQGIVNLTQTLLDGMYVGTEHGQHSQGAIIWSLNSLYEEALRGVLSNWQGATLLRDAGRASVKRSGTVLGSSSVKPDYIASRSDGSTILLDAKYKDVGNQTSKAEDPGATVDIVVGKGPSIRVKRSDVYQVVAYAHHRKWQATKTSPTVAALVFPVALASGEAYPSPAVIEGFDPSVHIVFFDVGPRANENLNYLYAALDGIGPQVAGVAP